MAKQSAKMHSATIAIIIFITIIIVMKTVNLNNTGIELYRSPGIGVVELRFDYY